jgi:hypothetical protein
MSSKIIGIITLETVALFLILSFYFLTFAKKIEFPPSTDFYKFYMSTRFYWEGKDIYTLIPVETSSLSWNKEVSNQPSRILHPNLNSPFYNFVILPFGLLEFSTSFWIWTVLSLVCMLGSVILIYKDLYPNNANLLVVGSLWLVMLVYFPSWANIIFGQFSFFLLLLITMAWIASRKGNDLPAGVILGLAMALKIFMGIFLLFFLVRRRWRLVCWMVAVFLLGNLVSVAVLGLPSYQRFLSLLHDMPWYAGSYNASFTGFFTRIFGGSGNHPLVSLPWLAWSLAGIFSALYTVVLVMLAWPLPRKLGKDQFDLAFSFALTAMLLISPYGWAYYFPLLFIPLTVSWRVAQELPSGWRYKWLSLIAWGLGSIPTVLIAAEDIPTNQPLIWFFTSAAYYFYSLLLFSTVLIALQRRMGGISWAENAPGEQPQYVR